MAIKRKIDELGRVTIPKIIREELGLDAGTPLEIREENGKIIIGRPNTICCFCGVQEIDVKSKIPLCKDCIEKVKSL